MSHSSFPESVDVLVVGGGPTGLIITYLLLRAGLKVLTVEQYDKYEQALYGRACVLHAGSLELLDLIGIYDRIADTGFIAKGSATFRDGKEYENRGWSFMDKAIIGNSHFDFTLMIRQKYVEDAVRTAIAEIAPGVLRAQVKLVRFEESKEAEHPVVATLEHQGKSFQVSCKYMVGADGGRSTVRSLGNFPFPGTTTPHKWVRLDAVIKTSMPYDSSRSKIVAIESKDYGNVLWLPVDNGRTRIGFVCPDDVYGTDGTGISEEAIMKAAQESVKPFTLEFEKLDWWTVYSISQRVADTFIDGHVILAGDAAHTHSSASAQGMNTGIHDATNLAWKLAGVVNGLYDKTVLDTYDLERRTSAERLIQLDRDIATLISGIIPSHFNAPPGADVNDYLELLQSKNAAFTVGLDISYDPNLLNRAPKADGPALIKVEVGHRALDAPLYRPGAAFPRLLRSLIPHVGRFWILIFAGKIEKMECNVVRLNAKCSAKYRALRDYIDSPCSFTRTLVPAFEFLTILHGDGCLQPTETIGALPLGKTLSDKSGEAYTKYGIDDEAGAIVVLRPDGIVAMSSPLDGGDELSRYFSSFVQHSEEKLGARNADLPQARGGEISIEGQAESTHRSNI